MEFDIERMMLRLIGRVEVLEERVKILEKQLGVQKNNNETNDLEMPEKISTNSDVRRAIELLASQELFTEDEVEKFSSTGWCNENLHLNFPLLILAENGRYDEKGYPRYWNKAINLFGNDYYICSQWFPHNRGYFEKWLKQKINLS